MNRSVSTENRAMGNGLILQDGRFRLTIKRKLVTSRGCASFIMGRFGVFFCAD